MPRVNAPAPCRLSVLPISRQDRSMSTPLCRIEVIPEGGVHEVEAEIDEGRESLLLTRAGSTVMAFRNICPHAGRPLNWAPGRFLIESGLLVCASHGASFSLSDGRCMMGPCRGASLSAVPVVVVEGEVQLAG